MVGELLSQVFAETFVAPMYHVSPNTREPVHPIHPVLKETCLTLLCLLKFVAVVVPTNRRTGGVCLVYKSQVLGALPSFPSAVTC